MRTYPKLIRPYPKLWHQLPIGAQKFREVFFLIILKTNFQISLFPDLQKGNRPIVFWWQRQGLFIYTYASKWWIGPFNTMYHDTQLYRFWPTKKFGVCTNAGQGMICRRGQGLCHRRWQALSGMNKPDEVAPSKRTLLIITLIMCKVHHLQCPTSHKHPFCTNHDNNSATTTKNT